MSDPEIKPSRGAPSAERQVADYLLQHPEFFERHLYLLKDLRVPHPSGTAVSLIERQVAQLRKENKELRKQLSEIVDVAKGNDRLNSRMQRLTFNLLEAKGLDDLLAQLQEGLEQDFQADFFGLRLDPAAHALATMERAGLSIGPKPMRALFEHQFATGNPMCGRLRAEQLDALFGSQANQVASAAVVPIESLDFSGVLGIGSRDPHRYQPGMGTLFLVQLGELLDRALRKYFLESLRDGS
ncbi:MAG: DUF484 family protein [Chromatiales bacterium]|nr:DUF484 family protein [Chromatiales bacterium]